MGRTVSFENTGGFTYLKIVWPFLIYLLRGVLFTFFKILQQLHISIKF